MAVTQSQWIALAVVVGGGVLILSMAGLRARGRARRRRRLMHRPLSEAWATIVSRAVPLYDRMPPGLRDRLGGLVQVFLSEKRFEGCGGLTVTDEMRVTVAAQACLLVLGRTGEFFPRCPVILLYPTAFFVPDRSRGVVRQEGEYLLGESWPRDGIVLAWNHVRRTAVMPGSGSVVVHEFSHQLDGDDGSVDGSPALRGYSACAAWEKVFSREHARLVRRLESGRCSVLGDYAASSSAEFFAEAVSVFFTQPAALQEESPAVYQELSRYFAIDPVTWGKAH